MNHALQAIQEENFGSNISGNPGRGNAYSGSGGSGQAQSEEDVRYEDGDDLDDNPKAKYYRNVRSFGGDQSNISNRGRSGDKKLQALYINSTKENLLNYHHKSNYISTTKYNWGTFLPISLILQFSRLPNIYFLVTAIIQSIPTISPLSPLTAILPLIFVLAVSMVRDLIEDLARSKYDKKNNEDKVYIYRETEFVQDMSKNIRIGELILVFDEASIPADMIVLDTGLNDGICYVETSSLDGEKSLKQKIACKFTIGYFKKYVTNDPLKELKDITIKGFSECDAPNSDLNKLDGKVYMMLGEDREDTGEQRRETEFATGTNQLLLKGSCLKHSGWVVGFVVYTGLNNKIILNSKRPRMKVSKIEKLLNKFLIGIFFFQVVLCAVCSYYHSNQYHRNDEFYLTFILLERKPGVESFITFFTYLLLLNTLIPISLIVTLEIVKLGQGLFIGWDANLYSPVKKFFCKASSISINEELGNVNYIFSDKTGTLTCNKMEFKYCVIGESCYEYVKDIEKAVNGSTDNNGVDNSNNMQGKNVNSSSNYPMNNSNNNLGNIDEIQGIARKKYSVNQNNSNNQGGKIRHDNYINQDDKKYGCSNPNAQGMNYNSMANGRNRMGDSGIRQRGLMGGMLHNDASMSVMKDCNSNNVSKSRSNYNLMGSTTNPILNKLNENANTPGNYYSRDMDMGTQINKGITYYINSRGQKTKIIQIGNNFFNKMVEQNKKPRSSPLIKNKMELFGEFWEALACAHECVCSETENGLNYSGISPDDVELVRAASNQGYTFIKSPSTNLRKIMVGGREKTYEILHILNFSSERKRMSIILKGENGEIKMFTKGADCEIKKRLSEDSPKDYLTTITHCVDKFSSKGYRTLMVAERIITENEYKLWSEKLKSGELDLAKKHVVIETCYNEIESNLMLLGATVVEDKLQDNVLETIRDLRLAGIKIWVLTGDKIDTAENIALSSNLMSYSQKIFRISYGDQKITLTNSFEILEAFISEFKEYAINEEENLINIENQFNTDNDNLVECKSLSVTPFSILIEAPILACILKSEETTREFLKIALYASSVVCCRVSPLQKSSIVKIVKKYQKDAVTLAVGDGGNDVSMIMEAHIGIGIHGEEGNRAVQASDFAIGEFRLLRTLLLNHGRSNSLRISQMIIYFFYKNFIFTIVHFFFCFYCLGSGQTIIDDWFITFYNLVFTSLPLGLQACTDFDIREEDGQLVSDMLPFLYKESRDDPMFCFTRFSFNLFKGLLIGAVNFFMLRTSVTMPINEDGLQECLWFLSLTLYTNIIFSVSLTLLLSIRYMIVYVPLVLGFTSIGLYYAFCFVADNLVFFNSSGSVLTTFSSGTFYLNIIFTSGCSFIIDYVIESARFIFYESMASSLMKLNHIGNMDENTELPEIIVTARRNIELMTKNNNYDMFDSSSSGHPSNILKSFDTEPFGLHKKSKSFKIDKKNIKMPIDLGEKPGDDYTNNKLSQSGYGPSKDKKIGWCNSHRLPARSKSLVDDMKGFNSEDTSQEEKRDQNYNIISVHKCQGDDSQYEGMDDYRGNSGHPGKHLYMRDGDSESN